ncbi:MAG: two-component sensor histidine kinase [Methyloversatilis discipulorum]|uniref:sensor histidine kinase n=1 Tax=Methyloversatilis TaxID=378210 RepID=UPI0026EEB709|nr:ATP-binding protein [Methyloversatilis discipulorum]MBT9516505.1 two-component sensor histidine kinase [Methyloversatilis discipulorum]
MTELNTLLPHGYCFSWQRDLLLLHVLSDTLIALAYFTIPVTLWVFVRRRADLGFRSAFVMFGVFIMACGVTHVMDVWTLWNPDFWLDGWIRAFTAVVSLATAVLLWRLIPLALALPSPDSLRRANEELRAEIERRQQSEAQLQAMNERMRLQIEELEAVSYAIAHDVRGPLRHIDGFARVLGDRLGVIDTEPASLSYLQRIRASVRHLSDIVEGLLAFSRASRAEMHLERCDTRALVDDVLEELAPELDGRELDISIGELPRIRADRTLMFQVFYNLIANAVKYTRGRNPARIHIECERDNDGQYTFHVRDNGAGFDMKYAGKLFGVFQRLHHAAEFEGTGIGLANVKRIVDRHGGRIWAEAVPGQGASFHFTLPTPSDPPPADATHPTGANDVAALA